MRIARLRYFEDVVNIQLGYMEIRREKQRRNQMMRQRRAAYLDHHHHHHHEQELDEQEEQEQESQYSGEGEGGEGRMIRETDHDVHTQQQQQQEQQKQHGQHAKQLFKSEELLSLGRYFHFADSTNAMQQQGGDTDGYGLGLAKKRFKFAMTHVKPAHLTHASR